MDFVTVKLQVNPFPKTDYMNLNDDVYTDTQLFENIDQEDVLEFP